MPISGLSQRYSYSSFESASHDPPIAIRPALPPRNTGGWISGDLIQTGCIQRHPADTRLIIAGATVRIMNAATSLQATSELTCPECGHVSVESMPSDACIHFHECTYCGTVLRPKPGDCCVFCSYGSVRCPPRL